MVATFRQWQCAAMDSRGNKGHVKKREADRKCIFWEVAEQLGSTGMENGLQNKYTED